MRIMPFMKRKRGIQFAGVGIDSGGGDTSALANKTDLTAIILTGTTNTSGDVISAGTWFYLNGTPCVAKVDIASGATFTEGTNYEEKTVGSALSELNSNSGVETTSIYQSSGITLATGWWCSDFRIDYVKLSTKVKYKVFNLFQLQDKTITANSKETIATIDNVSTTNAIYKPVAGDSQWILCNTRDDTPAFCYLQITDNGNITIYNPTSSAVTSINCCGIYI